MHRIYVLWLSLMALAPLKLSAAPNLELSKALPPISISDVHGGLVKDGTSWNSASMLGTLTFLVYVDPDDSELNDALIDRLHDEKFPEQVFHSVAIINLAATWKPNSIIMSVLRTKQEKFPRTTYVFDKDRFVAQNWNLTPEGYHVVLLDRDGALLYEKAGKLEKNEIEKFVELIKLKIKDSDHALIGKPESNDIQKAKKSL
ncbi:MAG: transcriptional regulator [Proteobacteria bacterium]|nr:transcriptional regulator [Pseudomonadota bacterium]